MESAMASRIDDKQWYLAVGERSLGPLSTELVQRGIRSGKVPESAWVCEVGAVTWSNLSSIGEFQEALEAVAESAPSADPMAQSAAVPGEARADAQDEGHGLQAVAPNDEDGEEETGKRSLLPYEREEGDKQADAAAERPGSFSDVSGQREIEPMLRLEAARLLASTDDRGPSSSAPFDATSASRLTMDCAEEQAANEEDLSIDITFDECDAVNWRERFQSYFLLGSEVTLPEEGKLLESLEETPSATFLHDEALWNLALCLAFGSQAVASASASTLFRALEPESQEAVAAERIEWICRTLLSKGFMPSGIPRIEGNRGVELLRQVCPPSLVPVIDREWVS